MLTVAQIGNQCYDDHEQNHNDAVGIGQQVSVHLYRPQNGSKLFEGCLERMDGEEVVIRAGDEALTFPRKTVSLVRLVPDLSALEDDSEGIVIDSDELPDE